jgi:hypothetical protein
VIALATTGQNVAYDPSTNVDINSGKVQPTAVRQTVTLLCGQALPAGSDLVTLSPAIQAAAFSAGEANLLGGGGAIARPPVVSARGGTIVPGSLVTAHDLVLQSSALGDIHALKAGNAFLTRLHDELDALLDAKQTQQGQGSPSALTPALRCPMPTQDPRKNHLTNHGRRDLGCPGSSPASPRRHGLRSGGSLRLTQGIA